MNERVEPPTEKAVPADHAFFPIEPLMLAAMIWWGVGGADGQEAVMQAAALAGGVVALFVAYRWLTGAMVVGVTGAAAGLVVFGAAAGGRVLGGDMALVMAAGGVLLGWLSSKWGLQAAGIVPRFVRSFPPEWPATRRLQWYLRIGAAGATVAGMGLFGFDGGGAHRLGLNLSPAQCTWLAVLVGWTIMRLSHLLWSSTDSLVTVLEGAPGRGESRPASREPGAR